MVRRSAPSSSATATVQAAEQLVEREVPTDRQDEIRRYLELFGYKPGRTILQAHVAGSMGRRATTLPEMKRRASADTRYKGRTFTVLGRTHDPSIRDRLIPPRPRSGVMKNEGYLGYLFMPKDEGLKPPHELLPLDFTPASLQYPGEWKAAFGSAEGVLIAMHVPSDFAPSKNEIHRRLKRIAGAVDPRKEWEFLQELEEYGYPRARLEEKERDQPVRAPSSSVPPIHRDEKTTR